jgi:hypothetical protein
MFNMMPVFYQSLAESDVFSKNSFLILLIVLLKLINNVSILLFKI